MLIWLIALLISSLAAVKFEISVDKYDLCLCTDNNVELNQNILDVFLKDMKLTYDRTFIVKVFNRCSKFLYKLHFVVI